MRPTRCACTVIVLLAACGDETARDPSGTGGGAGTTSTGEAGSGAGSAGAGGVGGSGGGAAGGGMGGTGGMGGMGGQCDNMLPNITVPPAKLSQTGLYSDTANKVLAPYVSEFAPQFALWSDNAVKTRWAYLGECDVIDNADEDNWSFPVGTRMWKQFVVGSVLVETRLIHRYGPGDDDFLFAAYEWDGTDSDADLVDAINGSVDAKGTTHNIPIESDCRRCHGAHPSVKGGLPSRYLGFGALQLSHGGPGLTMASLSNGGALLAPNPAGYTVPGDATEIAALGYLHANCANCHNLSLDGVLFPTMDMRLRAGDTVLAQTAVYTDVVNQDLDFWIGHGCNKRVAGLSLTESCVHKRMNTRVLNDQMPPIASEVVDGVGVGIIEAWIATLPPP